MSSRLLKSGTLDNCPHEWEEWVEIVEDGPDPDNPTEDALWAKEICCYICGEHWAIL